MRIPLLRSKTSGYMAAMVLVLGLTAACNKTSAPTDAQIAQATQTKIAAESSLHNDAVTATADQGVVTLSGTVNSDAERALAGSLAGGVAGVKTVVNNLTVQPVQAAVVPAPEPMPEANAKHMAGPNSLADKRHSGAGSKPSAGTPAHMPTHNGSSNTSSDASGSVPGPPVNTAMVTPPPPPAPPAPKQVTLPAGTRMAIRLVDTIDSEVSQTGQTFRATLDTPLTMDGDVIIPAGYDITGHLGTIQSAGRFAGQSLVTLQLDTLIANGKHYALQTNEYRKEGSSHGKATAAKIGGGAVLGAIIGGLAGGGKGAAIGTLAGAGAGTGVAAAGKGQQIKLGAETQLSFQLVAPLTVTVAPNLNSDRPKAQ